MTRLMALMVRSASLRLSNHEMNIGASFEMRLKSTAPQGCVGAMGHLNPKPLSV